MAIIMHISIIILCILFLSFNYFITENNSALIGWCSWHHSFFTSFSNGYVRLLTALILLKLLIHTDKNIILSYNQENIIKHYLS